MMARRVIGAVTGAVIGAVTGAVIGAGMGPGAGGLAWAEESAGRPAHVSVSAGGFAALTGPARHGPSALIEVYPGGLFGRAGAALYYCGFEAFGPGMVALGMAYEAGATRPMLSLSLHAELGAEYERWLPVVGGGVRAQLGVMPPLAVIVDLGGHLFIEDDVVDSRLALALAVSAGLAW